MAAEGLSQLVEGAGFALGRPLSLLAVVTAVLLCRDGMRWLAIGGFLLAGGLAASALWLPGRLAGSAAGIQLALAGACLASGWTLAGASRVLLAVAAGLASGWAVQLALGSPAEALGSAGVLLLLYAAAAMLLAALWRRLPAAPAALAVRVLGSWIAAVGLLMTALAWSGRAV